MSGLNIDSLVVNSNGVGNAGSVGTFSPAGGTHLRLEQLES